MGGGSCNGKSRMAEPNPSRGTLWVAYLAGLLVVGAIVLAAVYVLPAWLSGPPAPPEDPPAVVAPPVVTPVVAEKLIGNVVPETTAAKAPPPEKAAASFPT